jgi:hypothetical protein
LKSLRNDVAVFVFDKTDEHHNGASDEGNYVAEKNVHLIFLRFSFFSDLQNAVSGGNDGENVESRRNKVKMADIINSPENKGENNYGFEPYYIFGVDIPGEKNGVDNGEPGYGVNRDGSDGKGDLQKDKNDFYGFCAGAFCNIYVSENAEKIRNGTAVTAEHKV